MFKPHLYFWEVKVTNTVSFQSWLTSTPLWCTHKKTPTLCDWLKFLFPWGGLTVWLPAEEWKQWGPIPEGTLCDTERRCSLFMCVWVRQRPLDLASDGGTNSTPTVDWLKSKSVHVQPCGCYHWTLHTSVLSHQTITLSLTLCFYTFRLQDAVGVSAISLPVCPRRADRVSPFLPSPPLCTRRVTTLNQPLSSAWAIGTALETSVFMTDVPHACVKWDWSLLILYYLWILTSSWYRVWNTAVWNCSHLTYSFFSRSSLSSWPSAVITTRALEGCLKKKDMFFIILISHV